jgi:hypothetical protein
MKSKQASSTKQKTSGKPRPAIRHKPEAARRPGPAPAGQLGGPRVATGDAAGSGTRPLLTVRSAFILAAALAASAAAGVLSYLAAASLPAAFLAAGSACTAVITLLNVVVE